jgi:predicted dehydrogenase
MTEKPLSWGLLSTARINKAVIDPLRNSTRNRLHGIASRTESRAVDYAKQWDIPQAYASYEQLLDDPEIDVVYNPLPNHLHAEWTIKAAQAGKHVLCEKPLALSVEEVDAIRSAAEGTGVVVAEAFMYLHHPQTSLVRQLIEDGNIGDLILIQGSFSFYLNRQDDIRLKPEMGGGSIWDVGCYPISYARYLVGEEPEEVFGWQKSSELGVDLTFTGQMRFPNGVLCQFDSSFRCPLRMHLEISGSDGVIYVPNPFKPDQGDIIILQRNQQIKEIEVPDYALYLGEIEDMADAILERKPNRISLPESRDNIATIVALLESARQNKPVSL